MTIRDKVATDFARDGLSEARVGTAASAVHPSEASANHDDSWETSAASGLPTTND